MRKGIITICLVFCCVGIAFADVDGIFIGTEQDKNGNIAIQVANYVNGENVKSDYPIKTITNQKILDELTRKGLIPEGTKSVDVYYRCFRLSATNWANLTQEQQTQWAKDQANQYNKVLIMKDYLTKANADLMQGQVLNNLIGQSVTETTAKIQVSPTQEWEVKTDGTRTEKTITPVEVKP